MQKLSLAKNPIITVEMVLQITPAKIYEFVAPNAKDSTCGLIKISGTNFSIYQHTM